MGELEPDDSRDVTLSHDSAPGEPPRTGAREDEARAKAKKGDKPRRMDEQQQRQKQEQGRSGQSQSQAQSQKKPGEAQAAYGNSRDEQGRKERDVKDPLEAQQDEVTRQAVGETSGDPAARAKADAGRPLYEPNDE